MNSLELRDVRRFLFTICVMRVLVVTASAPWWVLDGGSLVLDRQLRHLADGHEITVLGVGAASPERPIPPDWHPYPVRARWLGRRLPRAADYVMRKARAALSREPEH